MRTPSIASRLRHEESGFTLIELLVSTVSVVLLSIAVLSLLESSARVGYADLSRDESISEQTPAFATMINDLRQAYQVNCPAGGCAANASSNYIDFDERVTSPTQRDMRVAYVCNVPQPGVSGEYECVRYETSATDVSDPVPLGTGCSTCSSWVVIQRVVNSPASSPVFSNLTTGTSATGATRWIAGKVSIYTPGAGDIATPLTPYKHDFVLSQWFSMSQLGFGR